MNSYLLFGLVVILVLVGLYFLVQFLFKDKSKTNEGLLTPISKSSYLTPEEYKKVSLGFFLSQQHPLYPDSLETGMKKNELKKILEGYWRIEDRDHALDVLNNLREKGNRIYFPAAFEAYITNNEDEEKRIVLENFTDVKDIGKAFILLGNLKETYQLLRNNNIVIHESDVQKYGVSAWDYTLLVYLVRLCYDALYITELEAWLFIDSAYNMAQKEFNSWKEYTYSYMIGYKLWEGLPNDDAIIVSTQELYERSNSPMRIPW